jgi:hypothetical protein
VVVQRDCLELVVGGAIETEIEVAFVIADPREDSCCLSLILTQAALTASLITEASLTTSPSSHCIGSPPDITTMGRSQPSCCNSGSLGHGGPGCDRRRSDRVD